MAESMYRFNETQTSFNDIEVMQYPNTSVYPHDSTPTALDEFHVRYGGMHGYISVVVCVFGIMANIANIVVLTRKNMVTTTNIVLTGLAVTDSLKMLDYLPFVIYFYILKDKSLLYFESRSYNWMCYLLFHANFSIICHTAAIWLTIVLAIFRFLMIWFPTRGMVLCTHRRAKIVIGVVYVCVFLICIPNLMINTWITKETNMTGSDNNTYVDIVYASEYRKGSAFSVVKDIHLYIQAIIVKLVPSVTLTIFTILLIYAMHKAYKKRMALKSQGKKEDADRHHEHNRTTGMLLAVVALFLFTELPQGMLTLLMLFIPELHDSVYFKLGDVLDVVALINNAINFVLYCSMSKMFRDTFVDIFCQCCPKGRPSGWAKTKLVTNGNGSQKNYSATNCATSHDSGLNNTKATYV